MYGAPKDIDGLPYKTINVLLDGFTLVTSQVHLSERAIQHIHERHPEDSNICLASIETIVTAPDFVGQAPHYPSNFEIIKRIENHMILVAISAIPNEYGKYPIQSAYIIPHDTVRRRLRKRHVRKCGQ